MATGQPLRVLHTSDWHLGVSLYNQKRYVEFQQFFEWLIKTIAEQNIHVLLIAGDIFDNTTPSNRAQELYYQFLCQVVKTSCRHVVITGGNHDSPSFLNAPKDLLKAFSIHVVGQVTDDVSDEVLLLKNAQGEPELIVLAVPYLRDRDIRLSVAGESIKDRETRTLAAIKTHYELVNAQAIKLLDNTKLDLPVISMGHLFTAGGQTIDGDGVRELYIGSLGHVTSDVFGPIPNYVALGHLHVPQKVQNQETIRYSGSPLPMSFSEANQEKSVCMIEFEGKQPQVSLIAVPKYQELVSIRGDLAKIKTELYNLVVSNSQALTEIIYDGSDACSNLRDEVENITQDSDLKILRIKNARVAEALIRPATEHETLEDLNAEEVFRRLLNSNGVDPEEQEELLLTYKEAVQALLEEDTRAE